MAFGDMFSEAFANPKFKKFASESLQDLGYGLSTGTNLGNAFGAATQRMGQMQPYRDQMAAQEQATLKADAETNMTKEWLISKGREDLLPLVDAGQGMFALQEATRVAQGGAGGAGATEFGLTPIWGQMPDGTFGYGVQGKDGTFRQVDTGELSPLDPRTLAGERAFGTQMGGQQGAAAASANSDIANADNALNLITQIKESPELPYATGFSAGIGGNRIPGTGRFGFQNMVDQAKSGAFLTAIQDMKGLGALSNTEGQVATAAITRMDTALTQEDFLKALEDYERIITTARERALGRVGMQPNVNSPSGSAPVNDVDNILKQYGVP